MREIPDRYWINDLNYIEPREDMECTECGIGIFEYIDGTFTQSTYKCDKCGYVHTIEEER